ncbi:MAG: hypothetical protein Q9179_003744 [Wetmoreana sp. 5 TL-2023]
MTTTTDTKASPRNHARSVKQLRKEASFYRELLLYIEGPSGAVVVEREVFEDRVVTPVPEDPPHPPAQLAIRSRAPKRRRILSDENMAALSQHTAPANANEAGSTLIRHNSENVTQEPTEPTRRPKSLGGNKHAPKRAQETAVNTCLLADQPSPFTSGTDAVFLSQLIPRTFKEPTRKSILEIFSRHAPYIPRCIAIRMVDYTPKTIWVNSGKKSEYQKAPKCQHPIGPNGGGWPTSSDPNHEHPRALPVEVFEMIGSLLPRDSVQNMRLVNREFEKKISCYTFQSVVVPFKPKIYGTAGTPRRGSGMGELMEVDSSKQHAGIEGRSFGDMYNPRETHVKDGMRVFQEWGPEIKKFALTFEVAEGRI